MKSFAAALLAITTYGSRIEATSAIQTAATAEIEQIALGIDENPNFKHHDSDSTCSDLDCFSSDYSEDDLGFAYRRRDGRRLRYFRARPRFYNVEQLLGRSLASETGSSSFASGTLSAQSNSQQNQAVGIALNRFPTSIVSKASQASLPIASASVAASRISL